MTETQLGKITRARFGAGGYDGAQFGLSVELSLQDGAAVGDFKGTWSKYPPRAQYTQESWNAERLAMLDFVQQLFVDAKVDEVSKLVGKPVEVKLDRNMLKSWRILTEVL